MVPSPIALYIHIPYCLEKCPYCDFHSIATLKNLIPEEEYALALIEQFRRETERLNLEGRRFVSVFFGGGTPSLMSAKFFETVLDEISEQKSIEITVETNPATADKNQFKKWLELGINRISFGTQSFQDPLLKRLGRHHSAKDSFKAVDEAKEAGFANVNCDLIFGIENETLKELEKDLQTVLDLKIPHVSAYQLTVESGTPLHHWVQEGKYFLPKEETLVQMHKTVVKTLEAGGLKRYEISNYAKEGFECRHNLQYWVYGDYLGIGSGAVSKIDGRRFRTLRKLKDYLKGNFEAEESEEIDSKTALKEKWMLGLRLKKGVAFNSIEEKWVDKLDFLEKDGFLVRQKNSVSLTDKGFLVSNKIIQNVFDLIEKNGSTTTHRE